MNINSYKKRVKGQKEKQEKVKENCKRIEKMLKAY